MDPFVMANDAQFFAPGSDEASYKPANGPAYAAPIRVIRGCPDAEVRFGEGTRIIQGTNLFLIRRSEVPAPQRGDLIGIGPARFKLQGDAQIDLEGLNWRIGAVEA